MILLFLERFNTPYRKQGVILFGHRQLVALCYRSEKATMAHHWNTSVITKRQQITRVKDQFGGGGL